MVKHIRAKVLNDTRTGREVNKDERHYRFHKWNGRDCGTAVRKFADTAAANDHRRGREEDQ